MSTNYAPKMRRLRTQGRRQRVELDPDSTMTRADWCAVALLPEPLFSAYVAVVQWRYRKADSS